MNMKTAGQATISTRVANPPVKPCANQAPRLQRRTPFVLRLSIAVLSAVGLLVVPGCRRTVSGTIPGTLPTEDANTNANANVSPEPVRVAVTKEGYEFAGRTYARDDANSVVADMKEAADGDLSVPTVILPTRGAEWNRVVDVFSRLQKAGFTKIGFAQEI